PLALHVRGQLQVAVLERCLSEITRRHEALRTSFQLVDGQPLQVIKPPFELSLCQVDLRDLEPIVREPAAKFLAREEVGRPFDLTQGPLVRCLLLRLGSEEQVVLLTMHHIVSDGWSMGILMRDLSTLYHAYTRGVDLSLPELPIQYADYAIWQREWLQGEVLEQQLSHWR